LGCDRVTQALEGLRIVELAESVAGEYCGKLLADFGAEVVKVERPGSGSPTRALGPFKGDEAHPEKSGLFAFLNTNKRSVALDIETDRVLLDWLLEKADAVIDDHNPGWLDALGLGEEGLRERHPGLSVCAITPFGLTAPPERAHATDLTVMQASGWSYHTPSAADSGRPPLKGAGRFMASYEAGLEGAMVLTACLIDKEAGAAGRFIDVSGQAVLAGRIDYVLGQMIAGDMDVSTSRHQYDLGGPAGIFPAKAGFVYIWMSAPSHWTGLAELLGHPAWMKDFPANWLERGLTAERIATVRKHLGAWLLTQDKDAAADAAQSLGLTMVPLNDAGDLIRSPQFAHRGFFTELDHPEIGTALSPGVPYKLSATPATIAKAAPLLGEMAL
jgi:crotonobetainyl-CoA:carnitine CoA-transferase CaiB-like acyl-CoA transferase